MSKPNSSIVRNSRFEGKMKLKQNERLLLRETRLCCKSLYPKSEPWLWSGSGDIAILTAISMPTFGK